MYPRTFCMSIALAFLAACITTSRYGGAIPVFDGKGIRNLGEGPFLLDFLAIKAGTEDRVVLEYDIERLGRHVDYMTLKIPVYNLDKHSGPGIIDVFAFKGDGEIKPSDFYAGKRIGRTKAPGSNSVRVDVTKAVQAALDADQQFIGFRLSTKTADRYFLGDIAGLQNPTLRKHHSSGH
jgi:hypothetical protein